MNTPNESITTSNNGIYDTFNPRIAGKFATRASAILDAALTLQQDIEKYHNKASKEALNGANSVVQMYASKALYHLDNAKKDMKPVATKLADLKAELVRWRQSYLS